MYETTCNILAHTFHFIREHKVVSDDTVRLETGEYGGIADVTMLAQHKCPFIAIQKYIYIK
jgi:hypothetical protein